VTHPGLPALWGYVVWGFMLLLGIWLFYTHSKTQAINDNAQTHISFANIKGLKFVAAYLNKSYWPLLTIKLIVLSFFILVIYAGLNGTPIPQKNLATVLTWNIWWAGLIVSIFFLGSSWCAVCPWDTLANLFVKPRLWFNVKFNNNLELTAPKWMRSVWPALIMFIGLTWLELGVGITTSPYWTALLSLMLIVMATLTLAIFKNKAFCHYICPIGRTVGFYSQLAPVELRPINSEVCASCTSLECYNGTATVEACPTQLVMGNLSQNTYCTSCGNCVKSCPKENVTWRFRPQSYEAVNSARPHWDEAWFMLSLLALTSFHGITMMEFWEEGISLFAQKIGDSGQLLTSFSIGLFMSMLIPLSIYSIVIYGTQYLTKTKHSFKTLFTGLVFVTLPLAFAYHLAHNLNHMLRESVGASQLLYNPLGSGEVAPALADNILKEYNMLISQDALFVIQAMLMMFGFWIAIKVLRFRAYKLSLTTALSISPMLVFIIGVNAFNLWMLSQPMVMRLGLCIAPDLTLN
jgi:polyferredoxin